MTNRIEFNEELGAHRPGRGEMRDAGAVRRGDELAVQTNRKCRPVLRSDDERGDSDKRPASQADLYRGGAASLVAAQPNGSTLG